MQRQAKSADVMMLGLPEFRVLVAGEVDGEVELLVETTATVVGCWGCGVAVTDVPRRPSRRSLVAVASLRPRAV